MANIRDMKRLIKSQLKVLKAEKDYQLSLKEELKDLIEENRTLVKYQGHLKERQDNETT